MCQALWWLPQVKKYRGWGCGCEAEHLASTHRDLDSVPSTAKTKVTHGS
jgi:hypothetical protein